MIEVEMRSFINENQYSRLVEKIKTEGDEYSKQKQITYYFKGDKDFRLMLTREYCQLWLKEGKIHDDAREELLVKVDNKYKSDLLKMLETLGYEIEIKWFRERNKAKLKYDDIQIEITVDYTIGYGYICEVEILVEDECKIENSKNILNRLMTDLGLKISEKNGFKDKYEDYKINWKNYVDTIEENIYL